MALFTSPGRESPPVRPVVPVFNVLVLLVDTFCAVRARTLSLCSCVPPTVQNGRRRNGGCWWWFAINGAKNRATGPIWWLAGGVMFREAGRARAGRMELACYAVTEGLPDVIAFLVELLRSLFG